MLCPERCGKLDIGQSARIGGVHPRGRDLGNGSQLAFAGELRPRCVSRPDRRPQHVRARFSGGLSPGIIPFASAFNLPRAPSDFFYPGRARSFHLGETVGASVGLAVDVLGIVTGMGMFVGGGGLGILALPESFGLSLAPASVIAVAGLEIAGLSAVSGIGHGSHLVDALERGVQINHNRGGERPPPRSFESLGIETSDHFRGRLAGRRAREITEENALDAYLNDRRHCNPATRNYIRHSSRTGASVERSAPSGGRAITLFEGNASSDCVPARWRSGL